MIIIDYNGYGILATDIDNIPPFLVKYPYFEVADFRKEDGTLMADSKKQSYWFNNNKEVPHGDPIQTQIQALTKQQEFLEDCIAEMAGEVYS